MNEEVVKTEIENAFKALNGFKTASVEKQTKTRLMLAFNVKLTYLGSITGPKRQQVTVNIKNNLSKDVFAANELITKDNKNMNPN